MRRFQGKAPCFTCIRIVFALLLLTPLTLTSQAASDSGRLEGSVLDSSGALIPGALVTVTNRDTSIGTTVHADAKGHFDVLSLSPGHYWVLFASPGFGAVEMKDVVVKLGSTSTLEPHLQVGPSQTQVVVTAEDLIDTQQSAIASVINRQSIESLPLNGRNFTDFTLLTPGATTDGQGMVSFNGVAGNFNNYSVDGANNNNAFFSQQIGRTSIPFQFSEDVIQEFQVTSSGFEAEFGQAGGGLVNSVSRSGTNDLHGDGYYYILDSGLNANDPMNKSLGIAKPPNRRQQFGGTLGGPVKKDKVFFIADYEGQIRNEPLTVNNSPAVADLPADFLANNPAIASEVSSSSGSFARSFNQNTAFAKLNAVISSKNSVDATYNYQRYRSPHGYFNTPTSTGDGLSLTDGATSHFFQVSLRTVLSPSTLNDLRFHFGDDVHFDFAG
jgi:hypothetical protein